MFAPWWTAWSGVAESSNDRPEDAAARMCPAAPRAEDCRGGSAKLDAGRRQHAAERISLHRWQWRGKTRFSCRVGSQELFSVSWADSADAQKIAEEGQRRFRAGDSYHSVREWLHHERAARRQQGAERISLHRCG